LIPPKGKVVSGTHGHHQRIRDPWRGFIDWW